MKLDDLVPSQIGRIVDLDAMPIVVLSFKPQPGDKCPLCNRKVRERKKVRNGHV